jgi:hypothetical protein
MLTYGLCNVIWDDRRTVAMITEDLERVLQIPLRIVSDAVRAVAAPPIASFRGVAGAHYLQQHSMVARTIGDEPVAPRAAVYRSFLI